MGGFTQWSWVKWYQTTIQSDGTTLGIGAIEADPKNPIIVNMSFFFSMKKIIFWSQDMSHCELLSLFPNHLQYPLVN